MRAAPGRPRWKARLARALGLDGNPLRRASDRAEAWIRAGLLVILLTAGPMAAVAAGQWAARAAGTGTSVQPHAVQAVLLQPVTAPAGQAQRITVESEGSGKPRSPARPAGCCSHRVTTLLSVSWTGFREFDRLSFSPSGNPAVVQATVAVVLSARAMGFMTWC